MKALSPETRDRISTERIGYRRPRGGGWLHLVGEDDRTLCQGHDASGWTVERRPWSIQSLCFGCYRIVRHWGWPNKEIAVSATSQRHLGEAGQ